MNIIVSLFISIVLIAVSNTRRPQVLSGDRVLTPPPSHLEYFAFGFQMSMADSLWVRAIQDFDYCEKKIENNNCKGNGWLFLVLDSVVKLAPDYEVAYSAGGLSLTVLVSDIEGASSIFDRGVKVFPGKKTLLYSAAYHALFEEKNELKAADLFSQCAKNGGPDWLYNLATRLYTDNGKKEVAKQLLSQLEGSNVFPGILKRMKEKIDATK